jgi:peptidoglycan L-alanyl-D-glutamate endopeptidase CwlK
MQNSRDLADLTPFMRERVAELRARLVNQGVQHVVASTLRDLESQAVIFRTGRPFSDPTFPKNLGGDIKTKLEKFRARGLDFLAEVVMRVGPQAGARGRIITKAAPGESWHNYGEAVDIYPLAGGKLITDADDPAWQVYGRAVEASGLEWAGRWTGFVEMPHAQLREGGNPLKILPPLEIRRALARWL